MRVDHAHSNDVLRFLGDITEGILTFAAGSLLPQGSGFVIVGASEVYSALKRGGLSGGARIAGGLLWMAGPEGMIYSLIADAMARLADEEDTISTTAYQLANRVFRGTLPPRDKIKISNGIGTGGVPYTFPRWDGDIVINLGDGAGDPVAATHGRCTVPGQLLVHELTHAWHYHNDPVLIFYALNRFKDSPHPGTFPTAGWGTFSHEQKGVIVDEWFARNTAAGLNSNQALSDTSFAYIRDKVRLGRTT